MIEKVVPPRKFAIQPKIYVAKITPMRQMQAHHYEVEAIYDKHVVATRANTNRYYCFTGIVCFDGTN